MAAGLVIPQGSLYNIADTEIEVDSNVTGAASDLVNVQSAQLEIADAGEAIAGVLLEAVTSASTSASVNITPYLTVVMDNDNDSATFASTDGKGSSLFDITGGTGAQIIDTDSRDASYDMAGTGQMLCIEYNPQGIRSDLDSDTSVGLFMINEHQFVGL